MNSREMLAEMLYSEPEMRAYFIAQVQAYMAAEHSEEAVLAALRAGKLRRQGDVIVDTDADAAFDELPDDMLVEEARE